MRQYVKFFVLCFVLIVTACGDDLPPMSVDVGVVGDSVVVADVVVDTLPVGDAFIPPPPCKKGECQNGGVCSGGNCECKDNYFGLRCETYFDASGYLVSGTVCPHESKTLVINAPGALNGLEIKVLKGAVPSCAIIVATSAHGENLPKVTDGILISKKGLTIHALDIKNPIKDNKLNYIQLIGTVELFYSGIRATLLYHNAKSNAFESIKGYKFISQKDLNGKIIREGLLARTNHFSDFFPVDHKPVAVAKIAKKKDSWCEKCYEVDVNGTTDEGKTSLHMLKIRVVDSYHKPYILYNVEENGKHKEGVYYIRRLSGGPRTLLVSVYDPSNNVDTKLIDINLNLCSGVKCSSSEVCREVDGKCAKVNNLCNPNPCNGTATCSVVVGKPTCTCPKFYTGQLCGVRDICAEKQRTCSGHGTCDRSTGECFCKPGYVGMNCEANNLCKGVVCRNGGECNNTTGKCMCSYRYRGDLCELDNLCWAQDCEKNQKCERAFCNYHGICNPATGKCACEVQPGEPSAYNGLKCEKCAADRHDNYPVCSPYLPCDLKCQNGGKCVLDSFKPKCDCLPGWEGPLCNDKMPCYGVTCQAHANCNLSTGKCFCQEGFFEPNCDKCKSGYIQYPNCYRDLCNLQPKPCQNGGVCTQVAKTYSCKCLSGYSGVNCEKKDPVDPCLGVTCQLNATCQNGTCVCDAGWLPPGCDKPDLCLGVVCVGHKHCNAGDGTCVCNVGWQPPNCDQCAPGYGDYPKCTPI